MNEAIESKKVFSKIGWTYTIFSAVVVALQTLSIALIERFWPDLMTLETELIISSIALYGVGILILTIAFKDTPRMDIPKKKIRLSSFIKGLFMCYSLLIVSNFIGTSHHISDCCIQ